MAGSLAQAELLGEYESVLGDYKSALGEYESALVLTSMEQPSSEPLSTAFWMMLKRLEGAFFSSNISVTPPVKSSKPSEVEPPDRAS